MSATEFAFLAFGLVLGVASGIALAMVIRSRPTSPRQVRLTIAPGSVEVRRAQTLAAVDPADHSAAAIGTPAASGRTPVRPGAGPGAMPARDPVPPSASRDSTVAATSRVSTAGPAALSAMPASLAATSRAGGRFTLSDASIGIPIAPDDGEPGLAEQLVAARYADPARVGGAGGSRPAPGGSIEPPDASDPSEVSAASHGTSPPFRLIGPHGRAAASGEPRDRIDDPDTRPPAAVRDPLDTRTASGRSEAAATGDGRRATAGPASDASDTARAETGGESPSDRGGSADPSPSPAGGGPCAEARQVADERCALAERTRAAGQEALDRVVAARRTYDEHRRRLETAEAAADPRAVRDAKESAQRSFRATRGVSADSEAAARDWLREINRINGAAREAQHVIEREQVVMRDLLPQLDRLELEADGARIAAESADAACHDARDAVARCEEGVAQPPTATPGSWAPGGPADLSEPLGSGDAGAALAVGAEDAPVILRLVRGDRAALERAVATLGGDDPVERRSWQRRLADMVDAIVARAIEASYLDFPEDHRFWGAFSRSQCRDIVAALASLGFRFDGLGGWVDARAPTQRDLSLAVGYAGHDPMRIRQWPNEAELADLLRTGFVAADEWLAAAAGGLTLGEMVDALGRRADDLTEVWNDWGKLRPALLATD